MNVPVQVLLEFFEAFIKCVKSGTGIRGHGKVAAELPDFRQQFSRAIVFLHHHGNGVCNRSEAALRPRATGGQGALQLGNVRKQDLLFFHQMLGQFLIQRLQCGLNFS